jgi:cell division protein FtsW (lipid II flippase)
MKKVIRTIKDMDRVLLIVSIILFVFGLFNIVTASSQVSVLRYNQSLYNYFYKQLITLLIGFVATIIILKFPTKSYYLFGKAIFWIIAVLSILVTFKGENWSGNQNWINILGFTFQPSEFAKPFMIIYLSLLFEQFYKKLRTKNMNHYDMIGKILLIGCFFPAVIFTQSDYGTMIIMSLIFGFMFLASPILRIEKIKTIVFVIVVGTIGILVMYKFAGGIFSNAQAQRFDFYDPCSKYETGGYQICNGFIAINSGGLMGVGIGNSTQKSYIPESHTDSVFAIIAEEYGFIVTSIIFFLYIVVLYRILRLSSLSKQVRNKYICFGVACYLFLHIIINLGGLFGSLPLTGVPLPFLSYGGSFTLSLTIALAVIQRIHIEYKNEKIKI